MLKEGVVSLFTFALNTWHKLIIYVLLIQDPDMHLPYTMFSFIFVIHQASAIKRFLPLFDRVLVERFAPELKTKGGIMLPEKSQGKVLQATVVATGKGARDQVKCIGMKFWFAECCQTLML